MQPIEPPNLDQIIKAFEKELRSLKRMRKEAAREFDHYLVYYHSEALIKLNTQLDRLYAFRDPLFNQKAALRHRIEILNNKEFFKKLSPRIKEFIIERNAKEISELKTALTHLESKSLKQPVEPKHQLIDEALTRLFNKRCNSFRLYIGNDDDYHPIFLKFKLSKKTLTIELNGELFVYEPDFVLDNRQYQPIKAAGFEFDLQKNKYVRKVSFCDLENIPAVKMWLAKFIIEDSWLYCSNGKMGMKYYGLKS